MLEALALAKSYPAQPQPIEAVAGVDLRVAPGEFLAIVGRSGSGKSSLLAMLGGQCRPSAGHVRFQGEDVWARSADARAEYRRRQVGFVFQFAGLLPALRVIDNVALPALLGRDADLTLAYARAQELLQVVGLAERMHAYPAELSGGQQRRVALARALVNRPPLLLADEPTAELDETSERELFAALLELHRRHGTALVVVTHSANIAAQADRVLHLEAGRVVSLAPPPQSEEKRAEKREVEARPAPVVLASPEPVGAGWVALAGMLGAWTAAAVLVVITLNYGAALFQRRAVESRRDARRTLQDLALQQVRADVADITDAPNGAYLLKLYATNLQPDQDLFLTAPTVRVFVQVGRDWVEVPAQPAGNAAGGVVALSRTTEFAYTMRPNVMHFEEQLAGYMHVRITATMLLARGRQPGDDLFERVDDYYVYLKPNGADDADIARRNGWATKPPRWIPMPAH